MPLIDIRKESTRARVRAGMVTDFKSSRLCVSVLFEIQERRSVRRQREVTQDENDSIWFGCKRT